MHRSTLFCLSFFAIFSVSAVAHEPAVNPLLQIELGDLANQEGLMVEVNLPPGEDGVPHRHNAHTFVYVLSGTVNMQVKGGELKTLNAGDTFYETPQDIHTVGSNVSKTLPAKLLVFFVKKQGEPATVLVE